MKILSELAALHIGRRTSFRLILIGEIVLLCAGICGLFGRNAVYEYDMSDAKVNFGTYSNEYEGILGENLEERGSMVDFCGISLPGGVYRIRLKYITDVDNMNLCTVSGEKGKEKYVCMNDSVLFSGLDCTDFTMWVKRDSDVTVHVEYSGGILAVLHLTIEETNAGNRIILFGLFCLFTVVNGFYLYWQYDRNYHISAKSKTVTFALGLIILISSMPLMMDYVLDGGDLVYHLMRVEGIRDGIASGQFPIRISPEWQQGYGYASPIFYGETVLYLAGMLRLLGFTVTSSYRIFMFMITVFTVLISYYCFKKIFHEAYIGVLCSMMYTMSIYRIYKTYLCGSWGECFGILFLPVIAYGFWRVFTQDIHEENYKRSWIPLTVGFSMLIQSHLLTCEMVGFFTIILCMVLWKKVFRRETFTVLAKTVLYSILLSAWFLVPFADYMITGDFVIKHVSARTIQFRGLYLAHLFFTFFRNGENVFFDQNGMADSAPMGVGPAPLAALLVLGYLWFNGRTKGWKKEERGLGKIAVFFSALAMLMSLEIFPWDRIQFLNGATATLVSSIQFPNRFLSIANVCLTLAAGAAARHMWEYRDKKSFGIYFTGIAFLLSVSSLHLSDNMLDTGSNLRIYNSEGMGTGYISGAEYLPYGADPDRFVYREPVYAEGISVYGYEKGALGAEAYIENQSGQDGAVRFPLLFYKGYQAYDVDSGKELKCYAGVNSEVTVDIPTEFAGDVKVGFRSPWYWRVGELVTVLTLLALGTACWKKGKGAKGEMGHGK